MFWRYWPLRHIHPKKTLTTYFTHNFILRTVVKSSFNPSPHSQFIMKARCCLQSETLNLKAHCDCFEFHHSNYKWNDARMYVTCSQMICNTKFTWRGLTVFGFPPCQRESRWCEVHTCRRCREMSPHSQQHGEWGRSFLVPGQEGRKCHSCPCIPTPVGTPPAPATPASHGELTTPSPFARYPTWRQQQHRTHNH